jgi:hypothetical protein
MFGIKPQTDWKGIGLVLLASVSLVGLAYFILGPH